MSNSHIDIRHLVQSVQFGTLGQAILKRLSGPSVQQPKPKAQPRPNLRPNLKGSGYFIKYRPPYRPVSLPFPSALTQVSRTRTGGFLLSHVSFLPLPLCFHRLCWFLADPIRSARGVEMVLLGEDGNNPSFCRLIIHMLASFHFLTYLLLVSVHPQGFPAGSAKPDRLILS